MISLSRATKRYGRVTAVDDVSLEVGAGQVVGILGPNGAGKTTTIRMIAGVLPPTAGRVAVDGLDAIDHTMRVRARLGYLPENNPLYPEMRVASYLRHRGRLYGLGGAALRRAIGAAIRRCWLGDVARRRIGQLSKGYRQRVGLAAALLHDPPVLILDEPTSGLDPSQIAETRRLIRELAGARTMLIVSHILPEVEKTCDRIVVFARGRIRADGAPATLLARGAPGLPAPGGWIVEVRQRHDAPGVAAAIGAIAGLRIDAESDAGAGWRRVRVVADAQAAAGAGEAIGRACAEAGIPIRELRRDVITLEQLYIRVVEDADRPEAGDVAA